MKGNVQHNYINVIVYCSLPYAHWWANGTNKNIKNYIFNETDFQERVPCTKQQL